MSEQALPPPGAPCATDLAIAPEAERPAATGATGVARRLDSDRLGDHLDRLFRAAWALTGNREDAEDLVQETFARVLARPRWLRGPDDLAYLLRALRNTHVARRRADGRRPLTAPLDERCPEPAAPADRRHPEAALEARLLFAAIAELPADFRDAVVAVDVVGLSYGQASAALRVREATLTTRLHRARRRLAERLAPSRDRPERVARA